MFKHCFVSVFLASITAFPVSAQSFIGEGFSSAVEAVQEGIDLIWPDDLNVKGLSARLGFGIGFTPDYEGSDNYRFRIIPLIDIRYKSRLQLNGSRLSYVAYRKGPLEVGPIVNMKFGRNERQNSVLVGFGNISDTVQMGVFVRYRTQEALVSVEYRHGLGANLGGSVQLTVGHGIYKAGKFSAMLAARARWLSRRAMQTNYGLTKTQSEASALNLPVYTTGVGFSELNVNLVGSYEMSDQIRLLGLVSVGTLTGYAAKSPIVTEGRGTKTQMLTGVGMAIAF
ncbi:MAG: MipA/OmpV family protein [Kordiimonadaceae bacterium]|nr:MipA/OmpV family protein [Kordiimonadaceae bacterium]